MALGLPHEFKRLISHHKPLLLVSGGCGFTVPVMMYVGVSVLKPKEERGR